MSTDPAQWHEPSADDEPVTPDSVESAPEPGEDYVGTEPRPDLEGEAAEADVVEQVQRAWSGDDEDDFTDVEDE